MGHTRMATQGDKKDNFNNHPFTGRCGDMPFALAHNGVLHNDVALRKAYKLPDTPIKTDSYIAVQLLEPSKCLDFDSIAAMAEQLGGSFTFTILDMASNMYFVKGDNPLALYHFEREGFYIYASTEAILDSALTKLGFANKVCVEIDSTCGDILRIDSSGKLSKSLFDTSLLYALSVHYSYRPYWWDGTGTAKSRSIYEPAAIANLKEFAGYVGIDPGNIEVLLEFGYSTDEIEDMLYTPDGIELALEEIFYSYYGEEW